MTTDQLKKRIEILETRKRLANPNVTVDGCRFRDFAISNGSSLVLKAVGTKEEIAKLNASSDEVIAYPAVYKELFTTLKPNILLEGGRGSAKTETAIIFTLIYAILINGRKNIVSARAYQNSIERSNLANLKTLINRYRLNQYFDIGRHYLRTIFGTEFWFMGLNENIESIKSVGNIGLLHVEEGAQVSDASWQVIFPSVRDDGSIILVTQNPKLEHSYLRKQMAVNDENHLHIFTTYRNNAFFTQRLEQQRLHDQKILHENLYRWIWEGHFYDGGAVKFIPREWIHAAVDFKVVQGGDVVIGFDVADDGEDRNCNAIRKGAHLIALTAWHATATDAAKQTLVNAAMYQADSINYDAIGIGSSVTGHFNEVGYECGYAFKAGNESNVNRNEIKDLNVDFYNIKAQAWFELRLKFFNTYQASLGLAHDPDDLISLSSDIELLDALINELASPIMEITERSKIKVQSKKDLKKQSGNSPDLADAVVMAYFSGLKGLWG